MKTLTLAEAADLLKVHENRVMEWAADGIIPAAKLGRAWVFFDEDLHKYIRQEINRQHTTKLALSASIDINTATLMDHDDIVSAAISADLSHGVYFLIMKGSIVYVGRSSSPTRRLGEHAQKKRFDSYYVLPCLPEHAEALENHYIKKFKPPLNERK